MTSNALDGSHEVVLDRYARRRPVVGTVPVAWLIFGGRWSSHVGFGGFYLTDLLLCASLANFLVAALMSGHANSSRNVGKPTVPVLMTVIIGWVVVRLCFSAPFGVDTIRDVAPYAYAIVAPLAVIDVTGETHPDLERTYRIIRHALFGHLVWCLVFGIAFRDIYTKFPSFGGVHLFEFRSDFDTAVVGVYAGLLVYKLLSGGKRPRFLWIQLAASLTVIALSASRAGALGAAAATALGAVYGLRERKRSAGKLPWQLGLVPLTLCVLVFALPYTVFGQRFGTTLPFAQTDHTASTRAASGDGTAEARIRTWSYLLNYSAENTGRLLFGVGFGPDFMSNTEAGQLLLGPGFEEEDGDTSPRSPHNYWLGSLLRTGALGVSLLLILFARLCRISWMLDRRRPGLDLSRVAAITVLGLAIPATLGVILESPFGALPYFWSAGLLLGGAGPARQPDPLA